MRRVALLTASMIFLLASISTAQVTNTLASNHKAEQTNIAKEKPLETKVNTTTKDTSVPVQKEEEVKISDGVILMFIGMSVVFLFLLLLIILMQAMSAVVKKFNEIYPENKPTTKGSKSAKYDEIALAIAIVKASTNQI